MNKSAKPAVKKQIKKRVAVGLSGGVDSAVAAALLKKQGYEVIGVHLYCYDEGPYCTAKEDRVSAVRAAKHLEIPLVVWDLHRQYRAKVIKYFFDEYKAGRTPNPDIVCNREIKFGIFMERALRELRVNYVATGHYARVKGDKNGSHLLRGVDETKDQSYFLYDLAQKQLEHILFPIGDYTKKGVRKIAQELNLPNKTRPDSQGICFIGPVPVAEFLREKLRSKVGSVVNTKGEIIGEHDGAWFFTEGQRHGFRLFNSAGLPLYVVGKNITTNTLVVGRGEEAQVKEFEVEKPHWIGSESKSKRVGVRIRHLGEIFTAKMNGREVVLKEPVFGVAPGQSAVFYRGEKVLGGGVIAETKIDNSLRVG